MRSISKELTLLVPLVKWMSDRCKNEIEFGITSTPKVSSSDSPSQNYLKTAPRYSSAYHVHSEGNLPVNLAKRNLENRLSRFARLEKSLFRQIEVAVASEKSPRDMEQFRSWNRNRRRLPIALPQDQSVLPLPVFRPSFAFSL
jgi:hypothetical protein